MADPLNKRIIVVDDEEAIVLAYIDFLAPAPASSPKRSSRMATSAIAAAPEYEILRAFSGEEAVALVKKEHAEGRRVAGGFFDVKMDGMLDGLQTVQEIWKIDPDMHCTVVTAYHDRNVNDIDLLFGERFKDQWDYLNKPFMQAEIIQKARQMVAAWNRKRALEEMQGQLVRSERMAAVGQVARAIGHEFGNLLQAIIGKADLASQEQDPNKVREKLSVIIKAGERASLIVRNLQSFSKTESARKPVKLRAIVQDTLALVGHELKKNSVQVSDQTADWAPVLANAGELEQVLLNLIINAVHAMPGGGTLEIGGKDESGAISLWVKDSGTGIQSDVLPRIFEHAFTTKGDKGSGLGLAISKGIVEAHGGTLTVLTELGKGTTFVIRLGRAQ